MTVALTRARKSGIRRSENEGIAIDRDRQASTIVVGLSWRVKARPRDSERESVVVRVTTPPEK
jgi:hypothetical protein